jgi:helix-turn-helix protein
MESELSMSIGNRWQGTFRMVPDALWLHPDLQPIDTHVWCALLLCARDRGECSPTNKSLAETLSCSVRTVKYSLARLEAVGFIVIQSRGPHRTIMLRPDGSNITQPFKLRAVS